MDNFWILFLVFTVYSFLGWLTESIFCSVPAGKFINRGFLNGPFCPVYGVGGVAVVSILTPFRENLIALYLAGVVVTSLIEYLTGFALEKIFHTKYWDYSTHRFNLRGRVCLENSLLFGVMCVVGMLYIHPALMRLLESVSGTVLPWVSGGFILYFACDATLSVYTIFKLNGKLEEMQLVLDEIKEKAAAFKADRIETMQSALGSLIDEDTKAAYQKTLCELYEKKDKIEAEVKFFQCRVISAFPTMKSMRSNESLQRMKDVIQEKAQKIRRG